MFVRINIFDFFLIFLYKTGGSYLFSKRNQAKGADIELQPEVGSNENRIVFSESISTT